MAPHVEACVLAEVVCVETDEDDAMLTTSIELRRWMRCFSLISSNEGRDPFPVFAARALCDFCLSWFRERKFPRRPGTVLGASVVSLFGVSFFVGSNFF